SYVIHSISFFFLLSRPPPRSTLFPYTTLFRSKRIEMLTKIRVLLLILTLSLMGTALTIHFTITDEDMLELDQKKLTRKIHQYERSEEHTSELQSRENLVCRLLLEKKKKQKQKQ